MLREIFAVLGFSTPFLYAAAIYWFFQRLDKDASGPAKQAISDWLASKPYNKATLAAAIVGLFDRIYGPRLFSANSFFRSVLITLAVTAIFAYESNFAFFITAPVPADDAQLLKEGTRQVTIIVRGLSDATVHLFLGVITNIISDYLSLFMVRAWLTYASRKPLVSLLVGPIIGAALIVVFFFARDLMLRALGAPQILMALNYYVNLDKTFGFTPISISQYFMWPAAAVHLWLPLLALCTMLIQTSNAFRWTASKLQWFLKQGHHHPLQAIGCVAALLVLAGTLGFQWLTQNFNAEALVFGAAVYGVFHFLDRKASSKANHALASYIAPIGVDRAVIVSMSVECFDRIYGQPLLSARSLVRSLCITLCITFVFYVASRAKELVQLPELPVGLKEGDTINVRFANFSVLTPAFIVGLYTNIASDYISLFIVRRWLVYANRYSIAALFTGPFLGAVVIVLTYLTRDYWLQVIGFPKMSVAYQFGDYLAEKPTYKLTSISMYFLIPAIAVHLWLPLLGLCLIIIKTANLLLSSVKGMQWLLKKGKDRPFKAIGYVAAAIGSITMVVIRSVS